MTDSAEIDVRLQRELDEEVAKLVEQGWAVALRRDREVILSRRPPMTIWVHVLVSLLTAGIWLVYVIVRGLSARIETTTVSIDGQNRIVQRFNVAQR